MSRPASYHDYPGAATQHYAQDDPFDTFALPLFNSVPQHSSTTSQSHHQGQPARAANVDASNLPPSSGGTAHTHRQASISFPSPFGSSAPPPVSPRTQTRQHHQNSMSAAVPFASVPYPSQPHHHLHQQAELLPPPTSSSSFGSLARSASLGARRKDPYSYSSDDVESGLGNMDMGGGGSWGGYNRPQQSHQSPYSASANQDVPMSPPSAGSMAPPPLPHHSMSRPAQVTRNDSSGSSPSRPTLQNLPSNPYIPRASDPGPSSSLQSQNQWSDYRPSPAQRLASNGSGSYSQHSDQLSPYPRGAGADAIFGSSPHSPLLNPYDSSPRLGQASPASPALWQTNSASMAGPPSPTAPAGRIFPSHQHHQLYPASQPVTPATKTYEGREILGARAMPPRGGGSRSVEVRKGFSDVRGRNDLRGRVNEHPQGRRADPDRPGKYLSPLKCLTAQLPQTYALCNPQFRYESSDNPRRVLTKPSKPVHNDGADNEDWDYILYVNDVLGGEHGGDRYLILDVLGQGTFGQVVKCQNMRTHDICAVKVVKNKPAYLNQSKMEVAILDLLNNTYDPNDAHHILRMLESFTHKSHLCLVFECLSSNLYELIKQNQFKGLSTQLVKVFTQQLLECLAVLKDARLIHCDLKPENILLKTLQSPQIKVIDFGSACHEMQTVYTYIQSRFYRSPEVLLGLPYSTSIDMWSLGCIVVELFLGLPLFPGTSEYNQLSRIVDMLGNPPQHLLEVGKQTHEFFNFVGVDAQGRKQYQLKPMEQYASEHHTQEQPSKQYFKQTKLREIITEYPISKKNAKQSDIDKEMGNRRAFIDFVEGLLNLDPIKRWSPQQAAKHPFITGEKFSGPFQPPTVPAKKSFPSPAETPAPSSATPKKYGGLVQSPSATRGQRIYSDAAAYNQQLAQHQTYTAQQQAAANVRHQPFSPGYEYPQQPQSQPRVSSSSRPNQSWQPMAPPPQPNFQARVPSHGQTAPQPPRNAPMVSANTNPPPNSYYPPARNRANTINQMDAIPPALARLTHFGAPDPSGQRNLTPVLNRDEMIREWERRQAGHSKNSSMHNASYPQLEYLQEQAELAAMDGQTWMMPGQYGQGPRSAGAGGTHGGSGGGGHHRGGMSMGGGGQAYQMQPPIGASPHHSTSSRQYHHRGSEYDPPLSAGGSASSSSRSAAYLPAFPPPAATSSNPASNASFDAFDAARDGGMGLMYTPLQPAQAYHYGSGGGNGGHQARASYSGPYQQQAGGAAPNNPFAPQQQGQGQGQGGNSPRYHRRSGQYGV